MRAKTTLLLAGALGLCTANSFAQEGGGSTTKNCFIEEFTSSTCPPCKAWNTWFDPMMVTAKANDAGSNLVIVKYQQDFPMPQQGATRLDYSFNAHSDARATYYYAGQQWGIPDHQTNGAIGTATNSGSMQTELTNCKGGTAKVIITGTYTVKTDNSVALNITVTPTQTLTGNYKVRVALADNYYENTANTTGQLKYYHVMRKMYPNPTGTALTSLTASTPQTLTFTDNVTVGNVTKGSFNFWNVPFNSHMIVWVQDEGTKEVLQAEAIPAAWTTGINDAEHNLGNVLVYPNPASEQAAILFTAEKNTEVALNVTDVMGRVVYSTTKNVSAGKQSIVIPTSGFANGNYTINLNSTSGRISERLSVVR